MSGEEGPARSRAGAPVRSVNQGRQCSVTPGRCGMAGRELISKGCIRIMKMTTKPFSDRVELPGEAEEGNAGTRPSKE
jgi:hypothetical protein